jgi:hypothetical protein
LAKIEQFQKRLGKEYSTQLLEDHNKRDFICSREERKFAEVEITEKKPESKQSA